MSPPIHNVQESIKRARRYADAPWWEICYRQFFPTFHSMIYIANDGWAQRAGIDRLIILDGGKHLYVDEKVRSRQWPDVLLEIYSIWEHKIPGWIARDLAIHYIAYAFIPTQTCLLLPFDALRRVWFLHRHAWVKKYRLIPSLNEGYRNTRYTTLSVAVPTAHCSRQSKTHW